MFHRLLLRLLCLTLLSIGSTGIARANLKDYPFRVAAQKFDDHSRIVAQNDGPSVVTAHVSLTVDNIESDTTWPKTVVLRPYSSQTLGKLFPSDRWRPASFGYRTSVQYGDPRGGAATDVRYRLPYEEGSAFYISQAYGSRLTTHNDPDSQHAVDFGLPEGTPIVAARDGLIVDMTFSYYRGGLQPDLKDKANIVMILHDDGTVAHYAHLMQRKPAVSRGEYVRAGTVIGYSGDTGYSGGPHLHFAVTRPQVAADGVVRHTAIPVMFYAGIPAVEFAPQRGMQVRAKYAPSPAVAAAPVPSVRPISEHGESSRADPVNREEPVAIAAAPAASAAAAAESTERREAAFALPPVETAPPPVAVAQAPQPLSVGSAEQSQAVRPATRTGEAEAAPSVSAVDAGLAALITVLGLLCLLAPKGARRTSPRAD